MEYVAPKQLTAAPGKGQPLSIFCRIYQCWPGKFRTDHLLPLPVPVLPLLPLMLPELSELDPDEPLPLDPLALVDPLDPLELFPDEPLLWDLCLLLSSVDLAAALPVLPEDPLVPELESLAAGMLLDVPEPVEGPEGELCASATPVLSAHTNDAIKSLFIYLLRYWMCIKSGSIIEMHEFASNCRRRLEI